MTKRFKFKPKLRLFAVLALASGLVACGSQGKLMLPRTSMSFDDMGASKTGAVAPDGKPYTSYSSPIEVLQVKESVPDNEENKKFGTQIEKAWVVYKSPSAPANLLVPATPNPVEVQVKWQGLTDVLSFQGQLSTNGKSFVARMTDATNQRPDLTMTATCSDASCYHGQFKIDDGKDHSVGIIINKENRTLKLKVPADPQAAGYTPNPFADQFKAGKPVTVTTTEIYPGKSYYEIEEITPGKQAQGLKLAGDLEEPQGDAIPVQISDAPEDKNKASLIGNDEEGNLLFKITPADDGNDGHDGDATTPKPLAPSDKPTAPVPAQPSTHDMAQSPLLIPLPVQTQKPTQVQAQAQPPVTNPALAAAPRPAQSQTLRPANEPPRRRPTPAVYLELTDDTSAEPQAPPATAPLTAPPTAPARSVPTAHTAAPVRGPLPTNNTGSENPSPPYKINACPIQVGANASAMVVQIMKDCGNSEVERYIRGSWASSKKAVHRSDPQPRLSQMQRFLYYNELRQQPNAKADPRDKRGGETMSRVAQLKTLISILDAQQFPEIWSLVTLQETAFNNMAVGGDGELGLWQFMADTADHYGLIRFPKVSKENDQRRNVTLETKAAVRKFRDLLDLWNGDVKMALASYNRGESGMQAASRNLEKKVNQGRIDIPDFVEARAVSQDFWYIYKHHMIIQRQGRWDYVPSVLAAMFTAVAPQAYGVDNVQPMDLK